MILTNKTSTTTTQAEVVSGRNLIVKAPPKAPITMVPSRPRLITPLRSANIPPNATRAKTEANTKVY